MTATSSADLPLTFFSWPTSPSWLYGLTQGLHVTVGLAAVPFLLAKLWSVIPRLFAWPPVESPSQGIERLAIALLVSSAIFQFVTGIMNAQYWYAFGFNFVIAHYYGAVIFAGSLALHVIVKLPVIARAYRTRGWLKPLRDDLEHTRPEPPDEDGLTAVDPDPPTISRRGLFAFVGGASALLVVANAGQSLGGPFRSLAFLAPRREDFPVNKTAARAKVTQDMVGAAYRLTLAGGAAELSLSRADLLAQPQHTARLPIACVEGWTTTQEWTGVRLADLARAGHYARLGRLSAGDAVAVYDFGGGTFDAAVVRVGPNGPELLGRAEGLDRLGGLDLDQAVMAHVNTAVDGALTAMDRDNPEVRRAALELRAECVAAKEALSADTDTTIPVRFPGLSTEVRLTRAEFETAVRPRVAETLSVLDRAIASAGLTAGDLAGVVLVGGTSRIPLVVEQVTAHAGRPVLVDADPKLSVATGAAEPNLRPASAIATATATREAPMSDTTRSTPPPPPGAKGAATEGGAGAAAGAAGAAAGAAGAAAGAAGAGTPPPPPGAGARTGAPKPSERRTASGNAPKEQSGMSSGGKVAAGVAAAAAATAAGVLWHEDVTDALGFGDDDTPADDAATAEADAAAADAESMDAFDAVGPSGGGGGGGGGGAGGGGGFSGGGGGGGGGGFAPPRQRVREQEAPDLPPPMAGQNVPLDPSFVAARNQLRERLESWAPPEGADPAEAAELRTRLEGMIDRYQPRPGQSTEDAIAELRDEFDVRIDNFTQDLKIDDIVNEQNQVDQLDPAFTAQRQQLLDRLENWTPPEGTTAERAAEIRTELQGLVERYRPIPGQPIDEAMAELQDRFDAKVDDFEQQDKIDILVGEEQAEQGSDTAGSEAPTMPPGFMPDGTPIPGSDMDPSSPTFDYVKHEEALAQVEAAKAAAETAAGTETPAAETPGTETPPDAPTDDPNMPGSEDANVVRPDVMPEDYVEPGGPDPRVTMPRPDFEPEGHVPGTPLDAAADVLVDDFDAIVGEPAMAGAVSDAVGDTGVMTAPPPAADAAPADVLGDVQIASAVAEAPALETAPVGAPAAAATDVVMDSLPPLVDDFEFEIAADADITFDAPEPEPAVADFEPEPEPEPEPAFDARADTTDDVVSG